MKSTTKKATTKAAATKTGLRAAQIRILAKLAKATAPMTRKEIAEKAGCDRAWLTSWLGSTDAKVRAKNDRNDGYPSLITLKFVATKEADGVVTYAATAKGKAEAAKLPKE
jgi:hypothetical protein